MNPALAGRVFVTFSWTGFMTSWKLPLSWSADAVSGATVLGFVKAGLMDFQGSVQGPVGFLAAKGYTIGKLPGFLTAMLVGIAITNVADKVRRPLRVSDYDKVGEIALQLFLAMSLIGSSRALRTIFTPAS